MKISMERIRKKKKKVHAVPSTARRSQQKKKPHTDAVVATRKRIRKKKLGKVHAVLRTNMSLKRLRTARVAPPTNRKSQRSMHMVLAAQPTSTGIMLRHLSMHLQEQSSFARCTWKYGKSALGHVLFVVWRWSRKS
jgi:hypothetical protein